MNTHLSNSHTPSFYEQDIDNLVEQFLATHKLEQTKKAYSKDILDFLLYANIDSIHDLIQMSVAEMSTNIIAYIEKYKKNHAAHTDRVLNPRTLNRKAYSLSSFFSFLIINYNYPKNPVKVYKPYQTPDQTSTESLDEDELYMILDYCKNEYHIAKDGYKKLLKLQQLLLVSCMALSLRRNEITKLQRGDIQMQERFIVVFGKGAKYKHIPLPQPVYDNLLYLKELKESMGYMSNFIFTPYKNNTTQNYDKPISSSYIFQLTKKICMTLGIDKNITPHSFRTTFVKLALNRGQTDIEIMNATGHATSAMIKYYDSRKKSDVNAVHGLGDIF